MLSNIYKIAIRQLFKNKHYALISISGLSVAIASALLMIVYLKGEWSYDHFHKNPERIYRVVFDNYLDLGKYATSPLPIGPAMEQDFPEIDAMTRFSKGLTTLVRFGENKFFENLVFVDTGFARVFHIEFVEGSPESALSAPNQVIISKRMAKKYFDDKSPLGQTLYIGSSGSLNSVITGVFENPPQNSDIQYDFLIPFTSFEKVYGIPSLWQQMPANYTYIRLKEQTDASLLANKLPGFIEKWVGPNLNDFKEKYQMNIQPFLDIHLHSDYGRELGKGNLNTLYLLGLIAFLVLLIAGINYINYATAGFVKRMREVSICKILGATRFKLICQFIGETLITVAFAGIVAIALAEWFLPVFNSISGREFPSFVLRQPWFYGGLGLIVLMLSLISGTFPAVFLSGFSPTDALRGKFANISFARMTRKGLMTFQFICSMVLLVATMTVWRQMNFIRSEIRPKTDEQVAVLQLNTRLAEKFESVKSELLADPAILNVSAGSNVPTFYGDSWPVLKDLNSPKIQMENYAIQDDFLETMGYELIAGRALNSSLATDITEGMVLNQKAVRELGFSSPEDALGNRILWGGDTKKSGIIRGVIKNFHFKSFREEIQPAVLQFAPYEWMIPQFITMRIESAQLDLVRNTVKNTIEKIDPSWQSEVRLLDDNFLTLHQTDRQLGNIFAAFALLAIFISTIGLYGLAAFAAIQRTKEVGIRKVLGASTTGIVKLLSLDFLKIVIIGFVLALPLAWIGLNYWLQSFAYRTSISWWIFAISGLAMLAISGLTVGIQGMKAAFTNPVDAIRSE